MSITVTKPSLPPLAELIQYLEDIWERKILTNNGFYHRMFEKELCRYLKILHLSVFTNGTFSLTLALQSLRVTGEVITTPYSFAATTHAIQWNGLTPVFVDVDECGNISPEKIEHAIGPQTTAIMAVHYFNDIENVRHNYIYFPIFVRENEYGKTRDELCENLKENGIFVRRYFYPLISEFLPYKHLPSSSRKNLPNAATLSKEVICLPMYADLSEDDVKKVVNIVQN